ncbi:hypothetical protein NA57DRAFT_71100 [Rhizodiscina lignyota]|uniref:Uncharacterized protein n=1 Tax=Rhizodiscina lignyota TaxID=1504668 RepID=A0A9P4IS85_9PEZI|nr:hypothetical protein NA57DRAFT_71100 [Rhizodiscina lignyota]
MYRTLFLTYVFTFFSLSIGQTLPPLPCTINPTSFFDQTLNHDANSGSASAGNGAFKQKYQLNTTHFKPGGPILFYQGAETSSINCIENTVLQDWAEEMGAMLAGLEHRFFGDSLPAGFNQTAAAPEQYDPLTLNNTLLDSVNFIDRVFVLGGSYGGTLTTLLRLFHPDTFYGAIPSAPLIKSFGLDAQDPDRFEWFKWVSQVYRDESAEAAAKIKEAMLDFSQSLSSPSKLSKIADDARLCKPYPTNVTEWTTFYTSAVIMSYWYAAQFNYHYDNPATFNVSRPLDIIVNQTLSAANNTGEVIRIAPQLYDMRSQDLCLNWTSDRFGSDTVLDQEVFSVITCKYLPANTIDIAPGGIFPPRDGYGNSARNCVNLGQSPTFANKTNAEIIKIYRFTVPDLVKAKRILFTQGSYDPTTAVGPPVFPVSNDRDATRTVLFHGLAHTEELNSGLRGPGTVGGGHSEALKLAHIVMKGTVMDWAGLAQGD